jgi:hypothetical protein
MRDPDVGQGGALSGKSEGLRSIALPESRGDEADQAT